MAVGLRSLVRRTIATGVVMGVGFALLSSRSSGRKRLAESAEFAPSQAPDAGRVAEVVRYSLLYVLPPIWLAASLADWACHRYSRIERTAGVKESLIHLLLLGEMGLPVLATLYLEITSPIILMMGAAFLVHEATVYADLRIAVSERKVTPTEQMVHSVMEMMPLVGTWLVSVLREDELRALLGSSPRKPDFSVRLKEEPLPVGYRGDLLTAIALFGAIPYIEELWRTVRVAASGNFPVHDSQRLRRL
jgi:hypothetical protein